MSQLNVTIVEVDIDKVHENPENPRNIKPEQFKKLVQSIKSFPGMLWKRPPVVVTRGDGQFMALGGNKRSEAARKAGMKKIPVLIADDWTDDQRKRFIVLDNDQAGDWDFKMLVGQYDMTFLLQQTNITLPASMKGTSDGREDEMREPPKNPISRPGDVWLLGTHRLACGDSTKAEDVERLFAGTVPNLMVTDPPYGVNYDPAWRNGTLDEESGRRVGVIGKGPRAVGKVLNDGRADWREAWALFPGNVAYVWHDGLASHIVAESLIASGFAMRSQIIWNKVSLVPGRGNYHWKHEPCWYAVRVGHKGSYVGDRKQSTVWDITHRKSPTGHGTQKPVECMRRPVENNSNAGEAVYDPFSGSGTTIIACEMLGRVCLANELDPPYVDMGVLRWQEFANAEATLEATGETFAQVQAKRLAEVVSVV